MQKGNLIKFGTESMTTGAATLHHKVVWESSTGNLEDLSHIKTRERVVWDSAPIEFGAPVEYQRSAFHNGLGTNGANSGFASDDHSIVPPEFKYQLATDGESKVWKMKQQYEMQIDGGDWVPIPDAVFEITRWFERKGKDLMAYTAKRRVAGVEGTMHRAMVKVPGWFK